MAIGDSYLFDQAGLAAITIPVMAMGGTVDIATLYDWGAEPTYMYASSPQKILVGFENGNHMIFGGTCDEMRYIDGNLISYWFCMDDVWDKSRVLNDLINHLTTAFLLAELLRRCGRHWCACAGRGSLYRRHLRGDGLLT
ncbi:MAG: hypothetical protein U0694_16180 [Anaerolineae bacterium]